jgi:hypothetical protein
MSDNRDHMQPCDRAPVTLGMLMWNQVASANLVFKYMCSAARCRTSSGQGVPGGSRIVSTGCLAGSRLCCYVEQCHVKGVRSALHPMVSGAVVIHESRYLRLAACLTVGKAQPRSGAPRVQLIVFGRLKQVPSQGDGRLAALRAVMSHLPPDPLLRTLRCVSSMSDLLLLNAPQLCSVRCSVR